MLRYLGVRDFALIESIEVEFGPGLNVLTGETGAGKTMLMGAIGLLLGDRSDSLKVRHGAEEATLSCEFDLSASPDVREALESSGYLDRGEGRLMLGRRVYTRGKTRCTINGRLSPVNALSETGKVLVDIHGQSSHQALLSPSEHLGYLDRFGGRAHVEKVDEYNRRYLLLGSLLREKRGLEERGADRREKGLLEHELSEIDGMAPRVGELEELEDAAGRLRNINNLLEFGSKARGSLSGDEPGSIDARVFLERAIGDVNRMSRYDSGLREISERLEALLLEVEDVAHSIGRYLDDLVPDPERLAEFESRLSALKELARKYGPTIEEVIAHREEINSRLEALESGWRRLSEIDSQIEKERSFLSELADELSGRRRKAARSLMRSVHKELAQLELEGAVFEVSVGGGVVDRALGHRDLGPRGRDEVEFMFNSLPGGPPLPLRKVASGGEMSRIMLALKIVLAQADRTPVLIFDEVDSGIGGETAAKVGEKLHRLTAHHQVFCVTHLPQIATYADRHYRVSRVMSDEQAVTSIDLLGDEARLEEICRMLGDSSGRRVTVEHARDILARTEERKRSLRSVATG